MEKVPKFRKRRKSRNLLSQFKRTMKKMKISKSSLRNQWVEGHHVARKVKNLCRLQDQEETSSRILILRRHLQWMMVLKETLMMNSYWMNYKTSNKRHQFWEVVRLEWAQLMNKATDSAICLVKNALVSNLWRLMMMMLNSLQAKLRCLFNKLEMKKNRLS